MKIRKFITKLKLFPILFVGLFNSAYFAQEIKQDKFFFGAESNYLIATGDLKTYWGNTFGAGIVGQYNLSESFEFEGSITFASFKGKKNDKFVDLPSIIVFDMPAGIKYSTCLFYNLFFTLYPGLQNNMFIFSGKAAEIIGENDIEYEFGIFLSLGLEYRFSEGLKTELYFKRQTIFSEPESILINYIGLKIFLFKL